MANGTITDATTASTRQANGMAVICLAVGLAIGYLFSRSQSTAPAGQPVANEQPSAPATAPASA
jgi:hypothetical protein